MEEPGEGIVLAYASVDEAMAAMKDAIDNFEEQHTDIFKEDITNLFNMNSEFTEQQRKILEALTYRVGTTLISDMKEYRERLKNKYEEIREKEKG